MGKPGNELVLEFGDDTRALYLDSLFPSTFKVLWDGGSLSPLMTESA